MKIVTPNEVYVQKKDIDNLTSFISVENIPQSIYDFCINKKSAKDEFIKFDKEEEISFFKNVFWIVDYNALKFLDETKITELAMRISHEKTNLERKYQFMSSKEKESNKELFLHIEILEYQFLSIRDVFWVIRGDLKLEMPIKQNNQKRTRVLKIKEKFYKKLATQ